MPHDLADSTEFECLLTLPANPKGVVLVVDPDMGDAARLRAIALVDRLATARYAACVLETAPRRGIALVSSSEQAEMGKLADRIASVTTAIRNEGDLRRLPIGLIACGPGSAAAMIVAARDSAAVQAVVSSNGRPDLAGTSLHRVVSPSLFIVSEDDREMVEMNRWAERRLDCATKLQVISAPYQDLPLRHGVEQLSRHAVGWFDSHMLKRPVEGYRRKKFGLQMSFSARESPGDAISR